jgi:hypothetical protein
VHKSRTPVADALGYGPAMAFSSAFGWARSAEDFHWHRVHTSPSPEPDSPPAQVHAACGVVFSPDGPVVRERPSESVCEACEAAA